MKKEKTKRQLFAEELIKEYQPKTLEDLQAAMKDIFGPLFETMLQRELNIIWATRAMTTETKKQKTGETVITIKHFIPVMVM